MTPRELKDRLHRGDRVYGTAIVSTSPRWPQAVAGIGLDFVFIDTEHIAIDRERLAWMCLAYSGLGLPPIVRITEPSPYQACMVLDGHAAGVVAPYVETADEARRLHGAVNLRPLKGGRLADALADPARLEPGLLEYTAARNADNILVLNIESVPAIEALDDILAVPGVDAVLIGPHDLSCSLGIPEQYDHPRFEEAVRLIVGKARARRIGAGIHSWMGVEREARWGRLGMNLIVHETDILTFARHQRQDVERLRQLLGDAPAGAPGAEPQI